jgi:hypothetical protein
MANAPSKPMVLDTDLRSLPALGCVVELGVAAGVATDVGGGVVDGMPPYAEPPDAEPPDAEPPDAEPPDAEPPDAEPDWPGTAVAWN